MKKPKICKDTRSPLAGMAEVWPGYEEETVVAAAEVKIFDLARSMSQRIEGQYRRHWGFVPGLWNLHFRNEINLGISLKTATHASTEAPAAPQEQDAAVAAADLYEKLRRGMYLDNQGRRKKIERGHVEAHVRDRQHTLAEALAS